MESANGGKSQFQNVSRVDGVKSGAIFFSGKDNFIEIPDVRCDFQNGFTIMFWVKAPPENSKARTILAFKSPGEHGFFQVLTGLLQNLN
jgi:hypothetical protein